MTLAKINAYNRRNRRSEPNGSLIASVSPETVSPLSMAHEPEPAAIVIREGRATTEIDPQAQLTESSVAPRQSALSPSHFLCASHRIKSSPARSRIALQDVRFELLTSAAGDYTKWYLRLRWVLACALGFGTGEVHCWPSCWERSSACFSGAPFVRKAGGQHGGFGSARSEVRSADCLRCRFLLLSALRRPSECRKSWGRCYRMLRSVRSLEW